MVDLAEQVVVADERGERRWPEASTLPLVREEENVERVLVESAGDDVSGTLDVLGTQRKHGQSHRLTTLIEDHGA
jgi:hypothetical protein